MRAGAHVDPALARTAAAAAAERGVDLLLLFGSRARNDARVDSDWDFAASGADAGHLDALAAELSVAVGSNRVDLVDLDRASALVRFHAARDGVLLYESRTDTHYAFQMRATLFWCDNAELFAREFRNVLARFAP